MKKVSRLLVISFLSLSIFSLNARAEPVPAPAVQQQDPYTMSVLWYQTSGEAKALYYQGYALGKMRLDKILKKKPMNSRFKPAIVLDIDETILDNSPCQALNVQTGNAFPANWDEWINQANAKALPGAVEFLKYAKTKGVEIYYISNRNESQKDATIRNLKKVGAPMADEKHVLLQRKGEIGKESRRKQVAKEYEIVLLFGDNLGDFSGFDQLSAQERLQGADRFKEEFGKKLIVFPNPMYGDWEAAIYKYDYKKTDEEKTKLRNESLQPFHP